MTAVHGAPLAHILRRQHGVISWRQARRHFTESAIRHRIESGRWQRVHLGVYLTHTGPVTETAQWWIASLAVGNGRPALLAGVTALRVLGLRVPGTPDDAGAIHIVVPARMTEKDPPWNVIVHRSRYLSHADVCRTGAVPCTTAARSVVDAAQWALTDTAAITLVAAVVQQRVAGVEELAAALRARRRVRRRQVIAAALADAGGGSESAYEVEFLRLCRRAGLPEPARQAVRTDREGRRRYRDVFFEPWGVHVEIDGSQHMEVRGWYADMRAGNEVAISGVRLLRFPGWAVRHRPDEVVADVRAALTAAGWRAPRTARRRAA
ncbi:type IV toxin-antitoxin system AbiEi family antitoxin domain-containing protein [Actinoplanes sp. NPDC023936]|uniref:type IV toxin-antitoxin system AbiEi family antitoxin domain-containing protein n=1 Tax=Actinoplanes sp. NPDC023936 TaxID=3154910 RepID=UPI0034063552